MAFKKLSQTFLSFKNYISGHYKTAGYSFPFPCFQTHNWKGWATDGHSAALTSGSLWTLFPFSFLSWFSPASIDFIGPFCFPALSLSLPHCPIPFSLLFLHVGRSTTTMFPACFSRTVKTLDIWLTEVMWCNWGSSGVLKMKRLLGAELTD